MTNAFTLAFRAIIFTVSATSIFFDVVLTSLSSSRKKISISLRLIQTQIAAPRSYWRAVFIL